MAQDKVTKITSISAANTWARAAFNAHQADIDSNTKIIAGVDAEWNVGEQDMIRLLIVSLPGESHVACFHLTAMDVHCDQDFPKELRRFLELSNLIACGVQIGGDVARLRFYGVNLGTRIELQQLAQSCSTQPDGTSLSALCRRYLGLNMDKFGQNADYSTVPLTQDLWTYGATDGWVSRRLAEILLEMLQAKTATGAIMEAPNNGVLKEGTRVNVHVGGKCAAKAEVIFVGGIHGKQQNFGHSFTVGKGRAIVRIIEVVTPTAKVPFRKAHPEWKRRPTIGWIFADQDSPGPEIVVRTSNLTVLADLNAGKDGEPRNNFNESQAGNIEEQTASTGSLKEGNHNIQDERSRLSSFLPPQAPFLVMGDEEFVEMMDEFIALDVEDDRPVSRMHEDLFHRIKNLPIPKTSPVKSAIVRLLIHASTHFVEEDYNRLVKILVEKKGILKEDLLNHFQFNKEYWRERVRMPTYPPNEHAVYIQMVHNFVKTALGETYTPEVKKYFASFEEDCKNGKYAELQDVSLFRQIGVDSDGLDLWVRLKGSVRCENIHTTMRNALGPHAMGAEIAHFLLILICFRYNVNLGIRRKARPAFGHIHLYVNDEIQIVVQEIYEVIIYPGHLNFSLYEAPKENAVGIRKLAAFSEYVRQGDPLETLTPDQNFIAKQLGVQCPPLPPSGKQEMQIINDFYQQNPNATDRHFQALAKEFLKKSDGKVIFPKLPSMLKADFRRWKKTSNVRMATYDLNSSGYNTLLRRLATRRSAAGTLLQFDDSQVSSVPEDPMLRINVASLQAMQYVPPPVAPLQKRHIPVRPSSGVAGRVRRCAWYPICNAMTDMCGGFYRESCMRVNSGDVVRPTTNEEKEAFENKRKVFLATEKRQKRQKAKKARTATEGMEL